MATRERLQQRLASRRNEHGLQVRESPGKGLGVFALSSIKKGDLVARYPTDAAGPEDQEYVLHVNQCQVKYTGQPWSGSIPFTTSI
eukprot:20560-Eustigmatos_ZCMA.PRE.1